MPLFRRAAALLVLVLHLTVAARPSVALSRQQASSEQQMQVPDCHGEAEPRAVADHGVHSTPAADHEQPAPTHHAPSHHDVGCHGAPCCAPVVPNAVTQSVLATVADVGFRRPLSGAARIIWVVGARLLPPATAPPATRLA
jgi:hypothetical protein